MSATQRVSMSVLWFLLAAACSDSGVTESTAASSKSSSAGQASVMSAAGRAAANSANPGVMGNCPTGYKCVDPIKASPVPGLMIHDAEGNEVPFACNDGKMMLVDCKDANPKASCPGLTDPICLHINFAGMDLTTCSQRCMP